MSDGSAVHVLLSYDANQSLYSELYEVPPSAFCGMCSQGKTHYSKSLKLSVEF